MGRASSLWRAEREWLVDSHNRLRPPLKVLMIRMARRGGSMRQSAWRRADPAASAPTRFRIGHAVAGDGSLGRSHYPDKTRRRLQRYIDSCWSPPAGVVADDRQYAAAASDHRLGLSGATSYSAQKAETWRRSALAVWRRCIWALGAAGGGRMDPCVSLMTGRYAVNMCQLTARVGLRSNSAARPTSVLGTCRSSLPWLQRRGVGDSSGCSAQSEMEVGC